MADVSTLNITKPDNPNPDTPQYVIQNANDHTMRASLYEYILQKTHQDIKGDKNWSTIIVRGNYSRQPSDHVSNSEKKDKLSNWHRPTTTIVKDDVIAVNCMPGIAYVEHYASLIATYYALTERTSPAVRCELPLKNASLDLFLNSNLHDMGPVDVVIIGYNYQLQGIRAEDWRAPVDGETLFSWQKRALPNGKTVAYLACMPSFWGEIGGNLIRALQRFSKLKCLIYLGKAGSLRPETSPNEWIVTGNKAYVDGEMLQWENVLEPDLPVSEVVMKGDIVTVPTPLCETFGWLAEWRPRASCVDCEVGHMARACKEGNIDFGYLHIISDNVAAYFQETLANEQASSIRAKRRRLFDEVEAILDHFLARY